MSRSFFSALSLGLFVLALWPAISFGQVTMSGSYTPSPATSPVWNVGGDLFIGTGGGDGTMTIANGATVNNAAGLVGINGGPATRIGTVLVTGTGSAWNNSQSLYLGYNGSGQGELTVTDGGLVTASDVTLAYLASAGGSLTISSGGTLGTGFLRKGVGTTGGTVTFDGGILRATVRNEANFVSGFEAGDIMINAGGATIDSNGFTIGISSALSGTGALTKQGAGTLTLTGSNTYTGGTTIRSGTLSVSGTEASINHVSADLVVGTVSGTTGALRLAGGLVTNRFGYLGNVAGSNGIATVTSGTWNNNTLYVGNSGTGSVLVNGGVLVTSTGYLGNNAGSSGSATVTSGTWSNLGDLFVGNSGTGRLSVDGGLMTSGITNIGAIAGSNGSATITGGRWVITSDLNVGRFGTGNLLVNGGLVTSGVTYLGLGSTGSGTATVTSGTWNNNGDLHVGRFGNGSLLINGGFVTGSNGYIATGGTSNSRATVTSGTWQNIKDLLVGHTGTGSLLVNGGLVTSVYGSVGFNAGSSGTATITSGTWHNADTLYVGNNGRGTLVINGGLVTGTASMLGAVAGSYGTATVSSGTWNNSNQLFVAQSGSANLLINGGLVSASSSYLGLNAGSYGAATVTSGTWNTISSLYVGSNGTGSLLINGGQVNSVYTAIGFTVPSSGTATVTSGTWNNAGSFNVGTSGRGSLLINGGLVTGSSAVIATGASSNGSVTVSSGTWSNESLTIANGGTGSLLVNGGWVTNGITILAAGAAASGTATVSSGTLDSATSIWVGQSGTGSLLINGGAVNTFALTLGFNASGFGALTLSGSGVLQANQISKGNGTGTVLFNGGTFRAGGNQSSFLSGFNAGTVTIGANGANIDSNGFALSSTAALSGAGGLTKLGDGTLTLTGSNTYSGSTTVRSGTLAVSGSTARITHASADTVIGTLSGSTAGFSLAGGLVTNRDAHIGAAAGATGIATVTGGTWNNTGVLYLGNSGTGSLRVNGGLVTGGVVAIGNNTGALGTATVTSGTLRSDGALTLGNLGTGNLLVNGGFVTNGEGRLGFFNGGSGSATVTSGTWNNNSILYVGNSGTGNLLVNGGQVISSNGYIGSGATAIGTATVTSGTWANGFELMVGNSGVGSLLVNGGLVTDVNGYIGNNAGSSGTATVTSGTWRHSSFLRVGSSGTGSLLVNGGLVASDVGLIGALAGSNGSATVTSGTWENTNSLFVGNSGTGSLLINGGLVTNLSGNIANSAGSSGSVTVTSGTWRNSYSVNVGTSGAGRLLVNGGLVTGTHGYLGLSAGSSGTATVTSGTWNTVSGLYVGNSGTGSLLVDGGLVTSASAIVGSEAGSNGTATVTSGTWSSATLSIIGYSGIGSLLVNGGLVSSGDGALAMSAGSDGSATVTSGTWNSDRELRVGNSGVGRLLINGGLVTSGTGSLGTFAGASGTATVTSGTWNNTTDLAVGRSGTGTLLVNGGLVTSGSVTLGSAASGVGSLTLSGSGVLQANQITKGLGTGTVLFNGGTFRAGASQAFLSGFNAGTVTIGVGGANIDDNGFAISTAVALTGGGGPLNKLGLGSLTLTGTSTFNNSDINVLSGTLAINSGGAVNNARNLYTSSGVGQTTVVEIGAGSLLDINIASLGQSSDSTTLVNVSGSGARLWLDNGLTFSSGTAAMIVSNGGKVDGRELLMAVPFGSRASLAISGTGSEVTVRDDSAVIGAQGSGTATVSNGGALTVNGGTGTVMLSHTSNTFGAGVLNIGSGGEAGIVNASQITTGTGTGRVNFNHTGAVNFASRLTGSLAVAKLGSGTTTLTGSNTYTGTTTISGGLLQIGDGGTTGTIVGPIVNNADLAFNRSDAFTYGSAISGFGNVYLRSTGTTTFTGNNIYSGTTFITNGPLQIGNGGATGAIAGDIVNSTALIFNRSNALTYGGIISGTGVVFQRGTGTTTLTGQNTYSGTTTIEQGTLAVNSGGVIDHGSSRMVVGTVNGQTGVLAIGTSGTVTNHRAYVGNGGTGAVTVSGAGAVWIGTEHIYVGATSAGSLEVSNGGVVSAVGTFFSSNSSGILSAIGVSGTGSSLSAGNVALGRSGTSVMNLTDGGLLTVGGPGQLLLTDANNASATLNIGTGGLAGALSASEIRTSTGYSNNSGVVNFNHTGESSLSARITGKTVVNKLGSGTATLTGSSSYTGATTISGGRLVINGSLGNTAVTVGTGAALSGTGSIGGSVTAQNGSTIAAGNSAGTLTVSGNFAFESGSLFDVEGDGAFFDRIDIGGIATITSGAQISFTLLTTPTESTYTLLTAASGLDSSTPFSLVGSLPTGYVLVYSGTSLRLVSQAEIGTITVTPTDTTIITGGTTSVTVTVENSADPGSPNLEATVTGTGSITGSGTTTVVAGNTGTAAPDLAFSSTTVGVNTGTVAVTGSNVTNSPQTGTTTVTVLDHSGPTFTIASGNNQSVIVGATGLTATLNLANGATGDADRSPMTVQSLSSGLSGTTGIGAIASGASSDYTASLNAGTVGASQAQVFTLEAGDEQSIPGASPLTTQSGTVTLNVYGHAAPTLSGTTFNLGNIHAGYGTAITVSQTATNGATGDYIVDLKADAVTSGNLSVNGISGVSAGNSANVTATLATGQGVGAINETLTYTFADDSSLAGASNNVGTASLNITGLVYSGQGVWTSMSGGAWGTLASNFGLNWQTDGGTPGLDASFVDTDTATFGNLGAGRVTLDGAAPSLKGITFDNATSSYELAQGASGAISMNGGATDAIIESLSGTHSISAPVDFVTDTVISVAADLLRFTADSVISGAGRFIKQDAGTVEIAGANSYGGGTRIDAGTLVTTNSAALGTGDVAIVAGTLAPAGTLTINSLTWTGGDIAMSLGGVSNSSWVNVLGDVFNGGAGGVFNFIEAAGFTANTDYTILSFGTLTGFTLGDFTGNTLYGITPTFDFDGDNLVVRFVGASDGSELSNNTVPFTPTSANFQVNGNVVTSNAPNTVNSLNFGNSSQLTVFNNLTVTSGLFTVNSGSATVTGPGTVIAPGGFTKLGDGLLNFLANLFVNGNLTVQNGALALNGNATAQNLFVQIGAMLKGSGIFNGNVFNYGAVAPGNSPGTLTINGNFTQASSGSLQIEIASPTNFDRLIVSGNAALAGQLQVLSFDGYEFEYGQQFAFLQAGSISGAFDSIITSDPANFRARFITSGGNGSILLAPTSYTLVAETTNQTNVARALDSFIPATSGDRLAVSTALDFLTAAQYPAAFDQIAPTYYESLGNITVEQAFVQSQQIYQRLSAVRLGASGFQSIGVESVLLHDKDGRSVLDSKDGKNFLTPTPDNKWGVWVMGNGLFGRVTNVSQVPNYNFNSGGFLVGGDYRWSENFVTGLFGGYQYTWADAGNAGNTQINSAQFGGYASYTNGGFTADSVIGGGYNNYRVRRGLDFGSIDRTASSQPGGGQFSAALNLGYDWQAGGFTFGPIVGGQYTYAGISSFTENGADSLDLAVAQQNVNSLRTTLGGRIAYTWNITENIALIPEVRMFWQHEFLNNPRNIQSALDGGSGPAFGYETSAPARDSVFAGAGFSTQFGKNWNAFFYYNIDFGRQDYLGNSISAGLNWKF